MYLFTNIFIHKYGLVLWFCFVMTVTKDNNFIFIDRNNFWYQRLVFDT
jgi:hypothetical protein